MFRWPLVLLWSALVWTGTTAGESGGSPFREARFAVKKTTGLVYGKAPVRSPQVGDKELLLDLYEPRGEGLPKLRPAVMIVHGGGFKGGSRSAANMAGLCEMLASHGFVCISIDYRLQRDDPPEGTGPLMQRAIRAAVLDANTALRWLVEHAEEYQIDRQRIAVGGGSAGAITSLILTYGRQQDLEIPERPKIAAVIDLWGSLYRNSGEIQRGDPPVIIIHGMKDPTVSFKGAEDIARRCQEVSVPCELCAIAEAGHGVKLSLEHEGLTLNQRIVNFLDTHLRLAELSP